VPIRQKVRLEAFPNGLPMSVSSKVYATLRFIDPSPLKGGDSLSGIFQWPVSGDVEDGIYTAIFGAYLSSGSTSLFPTLLVLNIKAQEEPPKIGPDQTSLSFNGAVGGSNPASKTVSISNTGGGTLSWTASKTQPWLTINPASGSSTGSGNPNTITISVDISGFSSGGTYNDTITIDALGASNTPITIPVTLALVAPTIGLNPQNISFNGIVGEPNPPPKTVSVSNAGTGGTLNWTASKTQPWLSINPTSGSSTDSGNPNTITVSVDIAGLSGGTYNDTITINAPWASNTPQTIPVTLTLVAPAIGLSLNPPNISFSGTAGGSNPASQTFSVWNAGPAGRLNWTASKTKDWLTLSPTSGSSTGSGNQSQITASVNTSNLSPGTYNDTITISAPGASNTPQTISVTLTLTGTPPQIGRSVAQLNFSAAPGGSNPTPLTLSIWNAGGGTLNWTASKTQSWLTINPASGSSTGTGNPNQMTVSGNISGLTAGTYYDTITISALGASNSPQTVAVVLNLAGGGATLGVHMMSDGTGGNYQQCITPNEKYTFYPWYPFALLYVYISNVPRSFSIGYSFYKPDGTLYFSSGNLPGTDNYPYSYICLLPKLYIAAQLPAIIPGTWRADYYYNDGVTTLSGSEYFTIQSAPTTPMIGLNPISLPFSATFGVANPG